MSDIYNPTDEEMEKTQKEFDQFYKGFTQQQIEHAEALDPAYFPCPECGQELDHYRNVEKSQYGVCLNCRATWLMGVNLFSSWKEDAEATWEKNKAFLSQFRLIDAALDAE